MSTSILSCALPLPMNYRSQDILSFHARDTLAVSELIKSNQLRKGIVWHGSPACLTIRFFSLIAEIELSIDHSLAPLDLQELSVLAMRMLGLNQPIDIFEDSVRHHPQLGALIHHQSGLRVPVTPTAFEALSWAIIGQQISVSVAIAIRRKFIQWIGLQHSSGLFCYPEARHVTDLNINDLRHVGFSHNKAQALRTVSQMMVSGELALNSAQKEPSIEHIGQQLLKIRGIGPWTVHYALLRGYGWLDGSLHGDIAVRRGLQMLLNSDGEMDENQTRLWLKNFTPWRALVAAHLWKLVSSGG